MEQTHLCEGIRVAYFTPVQAPVLGPAKVLVNVGACIHEHRLPARLDRVHTTDCAVVAAKSISDRKILAFIAATGEVCPIVLVTTFQAVNAAALGKVRVQEVVWLEDLSNELPLAVRRASGEAFFERIAGAFEYSTLPLSLSRALVLAVRANPPLLSVNALAQISGVDRRQLSLQWRAVTYSNLRLEDLVDWLILLRAQVMRRTRRNWGEVARELGVHKDTISRHAKRLASVQRGDRRRVSFATFQARFVAALRSAFPGLIDRIAN